MRTGLRCVSVLSLAIAVIPATAAAAKSPHPDFVGMSPKQVHLFLERVDRAPGPFREAIAASYPELRVKRSHSKLGGGNYTATYPSTEGTRFVVALDRRTLSPG